jgi:hypothetical protein
MSTLVTAFSPLPMNVIGSTSAAGDAEGQTILGPRSGRDGRRPAPSATLTELRDDFDESALPVKVDVVEWATTTARFREVIRRQSVRLTGGRPRRTQAAREAEEGSIGS